MSNKFKYPTQDELYVGIVCGGDSEDPASDKANGFRVWIPALYNPLKIKFTDLPFVRMIAQASQDGVEISHQPPERGTPVLIQKGGGPGHPGTGHLICLGVLPNHILKGMSAKGNKSLTQFFMDAVNHKTDKKAPPKTMKTSTRDGAEIREVEDGDMWSQSLTKGIPASATLWPMSGIMMPQITSVATAIQHSTGILNGSILSALPGASMSLGSMFSMLNSTGLLTQIKNKLSPEMVEALDSISGLITQVEVTSNYGFAVGGRVHPETFLQNAVSLLSTAQSIGDLVDSMNRLTSDDTLFGTENLEPVTIKTDTAFGTSSATVSYDGKIEATINLSALTANSNNANATANTANTNRQRTQEDDEKDEFMSKIMGFLSTMTSAQQAFASSGQNLFGDQAKMMFDMYNRLSSGSTGHMKSLIEEVNTSSTAQNNIKPLVDFAFKGGKFLSGKGFS